MGLIDLVQETSPPVNLGPIISASQPIANSLTSSRQVSELFREAMIQFHEAYDYGQSTTIP